MEKQSATLKQRAYRELKEYFIVALYLWVFLGAFIAFKSVILAENQIDFVAHGAALVNALVLGKFMLIAKAFNPGKSADDAPLIYPILLKAAIFAAVLAIFKVLEDGAVGYFHGKSFAQSLAELDGGRGAALLALTVILFIVLIPLTAFEELDRVFGEGTLIRLFFRPRDLTRPVNQQLIPHN